jgi:adenosylmethionine-8-amino-7-oxononanoate aminotransferase
MPYTQMKTAAPPLHVVSTDDVRLTLADGRVLIDGIASWWTACHGYNHPHITQAITQQALQMPHVMLGGIVHDQALRLSERVADLTLGPQSKVFFSESGSVAVEVALKIAVQYWMNRGNANRKKFICFEGAYHGDTSGAMAVCDPQDSMHAHFKGYLIQQYPHAIPETDEQRSAFAAFVQERSDSIAGVIIEPMIQMAAGIRMHTAEALNGIRKICQQHGLLMIADEVATGFGRTGSMFAFEQTNFQPDILCLGKALTGGSVPLAATVANEKVYSAFHSDRSTDALMHGPTFTGNAIACAAANASLDLFETEPRLEQVASINETLNKYLAPLSDHPSVKQVRIHGAVAAVEVDRAFDVGRTIKTFAEMGVFIRPIHNVVYLAPSFTIPTVDLKVLCDAIARLLK